MIERRGPEDHKRDARRAQQEGAHGLEAYVTQRDQRLRVEFARQIAMLERSSSVQDQAREYLAANTHYAQQVVVVGYGAYFRLWVDSKQQMSGGAL